MAPTKTQISDSLVFCSIVRVVSATLFLSDSLLLCSKTRNYGTAALFICLTAIQEINIRAYTKYINTEKYGFWAIFHLRVVPTYAVCHAVINIYNDYYMCGFKKFEFYELLDLSSQGGFLIFLHIVGILIFSSLFGLDIKDVGRDVLDVWVNMLQDVFVCLMPGIFFSFTMFTLHRGRAISDFLGIHSNYIFYAGMIILVCVVVLMQMNKPTIVMILAGIFFVVLVCHSYISQEDDYRAHGEIIILGVMYLMITSFGCMIMILLFAIGIVLRISFKIRDSNKNP